jgi:hypothetical protein
MGPLLDNFLASQSNFSDVGVIIRIGNLVALSVIV